jgi:hypothetical protein
VVTLKLTEVSEVRTASETSVNFNVTTWRDIPEDSDLNSRRRENLKSHETSCVFFELGTQFFRYCYMYEVPLAQ